jgi:hypothetical protein
MAHFLKHEFRVQFSVPTPQPIVYNTPSRHTSSGSEVTSSNTICESVNVRPVNALGLCLPTGVPRTPASSHIKFSVMLHTFTKLEKELNYVTTHKFSSIYRGDTAR